MAVIESKTIVEQISILKSRGMLFNNITFASNALERKNYYNIINAFKDAFIDQTYTRVLPTDPI